LEQAAKITKILVSLGPALDTSITNFRQQFAESTHKIAHRFKAHPDNDASDILVDILYHLLTDDQAIRSFLRH
jgi:hypothetical protein